MVPIVVVPLLLRPRNCFACVVVVVAGASCESALSPLKGCASSAGTLSEHREQ